MAKKEKLYYESDSGKTFKEAFAEARSEGKKTFEWNGEKYNTKLKEKDKGPDQSEAETKRLERKESSDKEEKKPTNRGGAAALAGAGVGLGAAALLSGMKRSEEAREGRGRSGSSAGKMPGSSLKDPYSMNLGSDLDPKQIMRSNKRVGSDSGDIEFKSGGKVGSASKRADGIAQRGKTRGRIC